MTGMKEQYVCQRHDNLKKAPVWVRALASGKGLTLNVKGRWAYHGEVLHNGDTFMLNVLDEVLTYEVDQIRIVLPSDLSDLTIKEDRDFCTLVTCTPYGINTHRLLVRGRRIETRSGLNIRVTADAMLVDRVIVAIAFGVPMLLIIILVWLVVSTLQRRNNRLYRDITR
jgi:hypothetical protein